MQRPLPHPDTSVIDWREWDDEWFRELPPQNPRPILNDGFRGQIIGWLDETKS